MDKYEIFAEYLAELEIADKVLPILFQNGFDEWEILKELNHELLTQMNIPEESLQNDILQCIQKADQEEQEDLTQDSNQQPPVQESPKQQPILAIQTSQKLNLKVEQEKEITIQDLLKGTSKKRENGESEMTHLSTAFAISLNDKKITKITNIDLCPGLKTLHLFQNYITKIECLDMLNNLTTLHLENNMIAKMEGFSKLYLLEKLYLNKNCISVLEGLENNQFLRELQISNQNIGNAIFSFDELSLLTIGQSIFQLDLDNSNVQTIQYFQHLEKLIILKIKNNKIASFESFLEPLSHMRSLQELDLRGNQICKIPKYRDRFVLMSKSLEQLDEKKILPKEREFLLALWKKKHGMMGGKEEAKEVPAAEKLKKLGKLDGKQIRVISRNEAKNPQIYQKLNSGFDFHSNTITTNQKHSIQTHGAPGKQKIL